MHLQRRLLRSYSSAPPAMARKCLQGPRHQHLVSTPETRKLLLMAGPSGGLLDGQGAINESLDMTQQAWPSWRTMAWATGAQHACCIPKEVLWRQFRLHLPMRISTHLIRWQKIQLLMVYARGIACNRGLFALSSISLCLLAWEPFCG